MLTVFEGVYLNAVLVVQSKLQMDCSREKRDSETEKDPGRSENEAKKYHSAPPHDAKLSANNHKNSEV